MQKPTFGINGFGRIGRTSVRIWWEKHRQNLDLKLINTSGSMDIESWAHLLKYDSNYGIFSGNVSSQRHQSTKDVTDDNPILGTLNLNDYQIIVTAQRDPKKIPWLAHHVHTVIESTGAFTNLEKASLHLESGAKKVVISAPAKGEGIITSVLGVKSAEQNSSVISNASCTTNCIAPVAQIMVNAFGVEKAMLSTIHSYTDDQNLQDNSHSDLRRARAAALNIVPTSTGATLAATEVVTELKGLFSGIAFRVPTPTGSLSDLVFVTKKETSTAEVNQVLKSAAEEPRWQGIFAVTEEPLVSSDIVGRPESSIADLSLTSVVGGNLVKIISWYDNEWGYCHRLLEQTVAQSSE